MTNAQKWVAAFLILFVALLLLGKVTSDDGISPEDYGYDKGSGEGIVASSNDPASLLSRNKCTSCHGAELQGTQMAPGLANLSQNWDRDGLINYLRNPSSYSGDQRFVEYKKEFPNIVMPSYSNVDVKDLGRIADYLLKLK